MIRVPIKVQRVPITYLSEKGYTKRGGSMVFKKPSEKAPTVFRVKGRKGDSFERVLWCPYCGEWTIYEQEYEMDGETKRHSRGSTSYTCQGSCGWAHTGEYYVRVVNNLWLDK